MSAYTQGVPAFARGYERFPGRIGRTSDDSDFGWPRSKRAREGAPNVVLVLLDDMGYSDIGPFGSEIDTPNLDRLAGSGVSLTNYHTTPLCSPSRAAMLTGCNPHSVGFGTVSNFDPGYPGQVLQMPDDVLTLPEILRENGYATFALGKWHLTRDAMLHDGAEKTTWPCQKGFDRYYGTLEAGNTFFHPNRLVRDNSPVVVDEFPDDYYLTDDLTDEAVDMIRTLRASDPTKPFFMYFAHHAMHGPLGAKRVDMEKYRGRYAEGWDVLRRRRFDRQLGAGLFPPSTPLPERDQSQGFSVPAWDDVPAEQQELFARYMEVYAAMVDNIDQSLGRILDTLEALGELDNTIVVFTSDNGGTMEGGPEGTRSYFSAFIGVANVRSKDVPRTWERDVPVDLDLVGGPRSMVHYPRGWGMVSNTPFRFYKGQTFAGGVRVPLICSWPEGLPRDDGDDGLRHQYQYVTDITPTILELTGVQVPSHRQGVVARDRDGTSFGPVLHDAAAPSTHSEQYAESGGNRGYHRDGWKLVTNHDPGTPFDDGEWQLFHVETDPNELRDVSTENAELTKELAAAWEESAWRNTVFPLIDRPMPKRRRPSDDFLSKPVRILAGTPTLERYRSHRLIDLRSFVVDVALMHKPGDEGVLVAHGDQGGGYMVFIEDNAVHLVFNEYGRSHLASAPLQGPVSSVRLVVTATDMLRWTLQVEVDGNAGPLLDDVAMLIGFAPWSGIDVGICRGGPVEWGVYERHRSFPYTGLVQHVTYLPGEPVAYNASVLSEAERRAALFYD